MQRWSQVRKVRALAPDSVQDWTDAVSVIETAKKAPTDSISIPIREASYRLFKDSKRIERLAGPIDVLLCGSVEAAPREPTAIWEELGLFREEHPVLLAGKVIIARERVSAVLDTPYSGLPAASVLGLETRPSQIMTIENLTTFHNEAKRRCDDNALLIYTAVMPSPNWRSMYARLLKSVPHTTSVLHWCQHIGAMSTRAAFASPRHWPATP